MTPLVEWLARAIALAGLVGAGAWALEETLRSWSRPTRFVWIGALVLSVALPLLAVAAPRLWPDALTRTITVVAIPDVQVVEGTAPLTQVPMAIPARNWSAGELLVPAWILSSCVFALRWLYGWWRLHRARIGWRSARVHGHAIYVSDRLGPAVVGLKPARVVLPAWLLSADDERLALIVRHEAEHARAGDPWLLAFAPIAAVLFPWSPAIWWQLRRLRLAIELDCDARVLRAGVPALAYGSVLLDVASGKLPLHPTLAALSEPRSLLERRIRAMTPARPQHLLLRAAALMTVAGATLFGATLVGAPATQVTAQVRPTPTPPAPASAPSLVVPPTSPGRVNPPPARAQAQAQDGDPIFVIDGVVQGRRAKLDAVVSKLRVGTIEVLKPAEAVRRYGERARFGAILVTTVPPEENDVVTLEALQADLVKLSKEKPDEASTKIRVRDLDASKDERIALKKAAGLAGPGVGDKNKAELANKMKQAGVTDVIFVIDGVMFQPGSRILDKIDPAFIESVEVVKGEAAVTRYGEGARSGVVIINLKH
jgi:hypothetical protein